MTAENQHSKDGAPLRQPMVRWYDPILLAKTGLRAAISTAVGEVADSRKVHAAIMPAPSIYNHSKIQTPDSEIWFDYVADLGDGWRSTQAVASAISQPDLETTPTDPPAQRGEILIMGGDEVYPTPSKQSYHQRTISPWNDASKNLPDYQTTLYALPGNHDWYDGLHAFSEIFCRGDRPQNISDKTTFDKLKSNQTHSYFALKLPHNWWVCGIDIALNNEIDSVQSDFFFNVAQQIQPGEKIILCAPTPSWVRQATGEKNANEMLNEIIAVLTKNGGDLRLIITGDLHHYSRYGDEDDAVKLITSGGGGAFMHPTHKLPQQVSIQPSKDQPCNFEKQKTYPDAAVSHKLSWHNVLFPWKNKTFSIASGLFYVLLVWFLETRNLKVDQQVSQTISNMIANHISIPSTLEHFFSLIPRSPEFAILVSILALALIGFNMTNGTLVRVAGGLVHTLAHISSLVFSYCFAIMFLTMLPDSWLSNGFVMIIFIAMLFGFGALLGGLVLGIYLIIALNVFNSQWTNAFSALRIADYKNFLRFKIAANGDLIIYPFAIEDVTAVPVRPHLIEEPIIIK